MSILQECFYEMYLKCNCAINDDWDCLQNGKKYRLDNSLRKW